MIHAVRFDDDLIEWTCDRCGVECSAALSGLTAGGRADANDDPNGNPEIIYLPPCGGCGSEQFIMRTHGETGESFRKVFNSVFEYVQSVGKIHPKAAPVYAKESKDGTGPTASVPTEGEHEDVMGVKTAALECEKAEAEAEQLARILAEQRAAEREEAAAQLTKSRRIIVASAAINKRLGRPPGTKPSLDELNAELAEDHGVESAEEETPGPVLENA